MAVKRRHPLTGRLLLLGASSVVRAPEGERVPENLLNVLAGPQQPPTSYYPNTSLELQWLVAYSLPLVQYLALSDVSTDGLGQLVGLRKLYLKGGEVDCLPASMGRL